VTSPVYEGTSVEADEGDRQLLQGTEAIARSQWQLFRRRFFRHKLAMLGLLMLLALMVFCFGATWLAPYKNAPNLALNPTGPSAKHWFGVDLAGKDVMTTIMYAGQISLKIGLLTSIFSTIVGTITGAFAGYFGGIVDQTLMRLTDMFLLLPALVVLAIALKKFVETSWGRQHQDVGISLVLAGLGWMGIARIVRGQVLSLKEKEFVEAARAIGASPSRIIFRHILPNLLGVIMVNASLAVAGAIVAESTLSFLGFGVQVPLTSWGKMLSDGKESIDTKAYLIYFPGLFIILVTLAVNFVGDGLRDAFDPQAKH
jgi:peptide/nickel transport system permease protein